MADSTAIKIPNFLSGKKFSGKKSPHKFSDTDPSDLTISRFYTLSNFFLYRTQKEPILRHLSLFSMYLKFHQNFSAEAIKVSARGEKISTDGIRNKLFILHGLINPFYLLFMQYSTPSLIRTEEFPIQKILF